MKQAFGPHIATVERPAAAPIDETVPEGMRHSRRITREEVLAEEAVRALPEDRPSAMPTNRPAVITADHPLGRPGFFRIKLGPARRIKVKIEEAVFEGQRRIRRQRTAFFDTVRAKDERGNPFYKRVIYKFENPVHCANLRCNPNIEEVQP